MLSASWSMGRTISILRARILVSVDRGKTPLTKRRTSVSLPYVYFAFVRVGSGDPVVVTIQPKCGRLVCERTELTSVLPLTSLFCNLGSYLEKRTFRGRFRSAD